MTHKELFNVLAKMVQTTNPVRAEYYDRMIPFGSLNVGVAPAFYAPHGLTVRTTLTCPLDKKIIVTSADLYVLRTTVDSAANGATYIQANTPNASARAFINDNTLLAKDHVTPGYLGVIEPGQSLSISTFSGDAGDGRVEMYGIVNGVEFYIA